jgi:hypothetical protein
MHWRMFTADESKGKPFRLHLLVDRDDGNYQGLASSYGFVEQEVLEAGWSRPSVLLKFTVQINGDPISGPIDVPDLETGMAVLMMNVKGNQNGNT